MALDTTMSRPELDVMLSSLLPGDSLVVWRLDRLGRSKNHLVATIDDLTRRGISCRSLTEQIDTGTASGRLILGIFANLAEFERALIRERTVAGLQAARDRGRVLGRPTVMSADKISAARSLISAGATVTKAAAAIGVSRPTLYRHLLAAELN